MQLPNIYDEINWKDLERQFEVLFPTWELSFSDLVKQVAEGNGIGLFQVLEENIKDIFLMEWNQLRHIALTITVVIFISTIFTTFKEAFRNYQIAEISFYINYLIIVMIFLNLFSETLETAEESLNTIESFMRIFFPTYALVMGASIGAGTGIWYYQMFAILIYIVEKCLLSIMLPGISIFMLFVIMNGIWEEEKLSLLLNFIKKAMKFALKFILGILTGTSMLQGLITPVIEKMKGETVYKAVEAIPGIGEIAQGAIRLWLGSAVLVKNSVGIVGCTVLILISLAPLIRIFTVGSILKILAAVLSIVGDKKMIQCTNQVGDGIFLVLQTVGYGIIFFVVLIAMAAYITNGGF